MISVRFVSRRRRWRIFDLRFGGLRWLWDGRREDTIHVDAKILGMIPTEIVLMVFGADTLYYTHFVCDMISSRDGMDLVLGWKDMVL